ncbi:hypothetical protein ECZC06_54650 [Escherichia coli]|nr:hypothetical protein ECZC06_54650 [Escherichia coli]
MFCEAAGRDRQTIAGFYDELWFVVDKEQFYRESMNYGWQKTGAFAGTLKREKPPHLRCVFLFPKRDWGRTYEDTGGYPEI